MHQTNSENRFCDVAAAIGGKEQWCVVSRNDEKMSGYTLFNASRETYLIDEDGQVVHQWRSSRQVFVSYLLPSGNLLRDGGVASESPGFQVGGASGVVEEVTWDNDPVWVYDFYPYQQTLSHHDLEPLENGHVLVIALGAQE